MINSAFADRFFGATIPADNLQARRPGVIQLVARMDGGLVRGWRIEYVFGADDGVEWLEYYATHRFTSGAMHARIYEDVRVEDLPVPRELRKIDPDPEKDAEDHRNYLAWNKRVDEELRVAGFDRPEWRDDDHPDVCTQVVSPTALR